MILDNLSNQLNGAPVHQFPKRSSADMILFVVYVVTFLKAINIYVSDPVCVKGIYM